MKPLNVYQKLYVWALEAKMTMGLYFTAFVMLYLVAGWFVGVSALSLPIAAQMLAVALVIGAAQALLLPDGRATPGRSIALIAIGTAATLIGGLWGRWFDGFPPVLSALFFLFIALSFVALILGYQFRARRETSALNEGLFQYKAR